MRGTEPFGEPTPKIHLQRIRLPNQIMDIYVTLIYTQLVNFESNEFHVKTAKTVVEACELAKAGFDYFTAIDDVQIFRKRK